MRPQTDRAFEVVTKLDRLRTQMTAREVDAVVLNQLPNIAWLTAGASTYINLASDTGPSSLLITLDKAYVITDRIEAGRLEQEESLPALGFTLAVEPWDQRGAQLTTLIAGKRLAQDGPGQGTDLSSAFQTLRTHLQPEEVERLQQIGSFASAAIAEVMYAIRPGMTEQAIAGLLAEASLARGGHAVVNLVASDERIAHYRHPLPTGKAVEHYVMVALVLALSGTHCCRDTPVHFGPIPDEIATKAQAVARVDAQNDLGHTCWQDNGRRCTPSPIRHTTTKAIPQPLWSITRVAALPICRVKSLRCPTQLLVIAEFQASAWNPSICGAKAEDTIILGPSGSTDDYSNTRLAGGACHHRRPDHSTSRYP